MMSSAKFNVAQDIFECAVDPHILPDHLIWLTDGDCRPYVLDDGEWRFAIVYDPETYSEGELREITMRLFLYGWREFAFQSLSFPAGYWDEVLSPGSADERTIVLLNPSIFPPALTIENVRIERRGGL
jgi:hypothetical protein